MRTRPTCSYQKNGRIITRRSSSLTDIYAHLLVNHYVRIAFGTVDRFGVLQSASRNLPLVSVLLSNVAEAQLLFSLKGTESYRNVAFNRQLDWSLVVLVDHNQFHQILR